MPKLVPDAPTDSTVYTPPDLARRIVAHFKPTGALLDPCKGKGAFYEAMRKAQRKNPLQIGRVDWMEIDKGRDFLTGTPPLCVVDKPRWTRYNWIITNPPWGRALFLPFLVRAMECADNIVFLSLVPNYFQTAKINAMRAAGFAVAETCYVTETIAEPWPRTGFALGAVHIKRGHTGGIKETTLELK